MGLLNLANRMATGVSDWTGLTLKFSRLMAALSTGGQETVSWYPWQVKVILVLFAISVIVIGSLTLLYNISVVQVTKPRGYELPNWLPSNMINSFLAPPWLELQYNISDYSFKYIRCEVNLIVNEWIYLILTVHIFISLNKRHDWLIHTSPEVNKITIFNLDWTKWRIKHRNRATLDNSWG